MGKPYTTPPYNPKNDASPAFDQSLIDKSDPGGVKAAKKKVLAAMDKGSPMYGPAPVYPAPKGEKRVPGETRKHQKQGWLKGR